MKHFFVIIWSAVGLTFSSCYLGEELPADQDVWLYSQPSEVNLSEETLLALDANIKNGFYGNINSLIIIKDHKLVFENYYDLSQRHKKRPVGKISSVFIVTAIDLLVRDGYIENIEQPVYLFLPEYEDLFKADPAKKEITIRHILLNKSGLVWNESNDPFSPSNDLNQMKDSPDWGRYVLSKPLEALPGQRYVENTGAMYVLTKVLKNALGPEDLRQYLDEALFSAIDITDYTWEKDPQGMPNGGDGLLLSTLDLTKFGYLIQQNGRWKKARVISGQWIEEMTRVQHEISQEFSAGYGWSRYTDPVAASLGLSSNDVVYTAGIAGQYLYVIPHLDMVISIGANNHDTPGYLYVNSFLIFSNIAQSTQQAVPSN